MKIRVFVNDVLLQELIAMAHRFYINIGVHGDGVKFVVFGFALEIFGFEFGNDAQDVIRFIQICGHFVHIGVIEGVPWWIFFTFLVMFWFDFKQV